MMNKGALPYMRSIVLLVLGLFLVAFAVACGGTPASTLAPATDTSIPTSVPATETMLPVTVLAPATSAAPEATVTATAGATVGVSFMKDVLPILQANCFSCHSGSRPRAGVDLSTYGSLTANYGGAFLVKPGDVQNSILVQVTSTGFMPRGGSPLSASQIQTIIDWINAGAPNN